MALISVHTFFEFSFFSHLAVYIILLYLHIHFCCGELHYCQAGKSLISGGVYIVIIYQTFGITVPQLSRLYRLSTPESYSTCIRRLLTSHDLVRGKIHVT